MRITKQINSNECGICVLKSLVEHYHHKTIDITDLINGANLNENGLTIYDLEYQANQYGLELESYEAEIDDIIKQHHKQFYILILNQNGLNHYVIARTISKEQIRIYCSENGQYDIHIDNLKNIWTGILITINKKIINENFNISLKDKIKFLNWKYVVLINVINLVSILISIIGASFMQNILNLVINNHYWKNLLGISMIFLICYLSEIFVHWILELLMQKKVFVDYKIMHKNVINILNNKTDSFYRKIDWTSIISFDEYLFSISSFYNTKLNKILADTILVALSSILLLIINRWLFVLVLINLLILSALEFMKFKWLDQNVKQFKEAEICYSNNIMKWLTFNKQNQYQIVSNNQEQDIKKSFNKIKSSYAKSNVFTTLTISVDAIINTIIYIFQINLLTFFTVKGQLEYAKMIFAISIFQMNSSSIKSITSIINTISSLKVHKQLLNKIIDVENREQKQGLNYSLPYIINVDKFNFFNDTLLTGLSGSGKTTILKNICLKLKNKNINFNNIDINLYNSNSMSSNIYYLSNSDYYYEQNLINLLNSNNNQVIVEILNSMNLKSLDFDNLSTGQKQALAFISLINEKDKTILIDEALGNVDNEMKHFLLTTIKPLIVEHNFLIMVDHNVSGDYFNHVVNINE